jgi:hypothetical protein
MKQGLSSVAILATFAAICWVASGGRGAQREQLRDFMRVKLKHSQRRWRVWYSTTLRWLSGVAQDMSTFSLDETWQIMTTPDYLQHKPQVSPRRGGTRGRR